MSAGEGSARFDGQISLQTDTILKMWVAGPTWQGGSFTKGQNVTQGSAVGKSTKVPQDRLQESLHCTTTCMKSIVRLVHRRHSHRRGVIQVVGTFQKAQNWFKKIQVLLE